MYIIISGQHSLMDKGKTLSVLYGVVLVLFGLAMPLVEVHMGRWGKDHRFVVFPVFLQAFSILYILSLEIYFCVTQRKDRQGSYDVRGISEKRDSDSQRKTLGDDVISETDAPTEASRDTGDDRSGLMRKDLYLPVGAALFGLGSLVYDALRMKGIIEHPDTSGCGEKRISWPAIVQLTFWLVQTYFVIKHPKIKLRFHEAAIRMGLMHILATNICTGIRTLIREITDAHLLITKGNLTTNETKRMEALCGFSTRLDIHAAPYLYPMVIQFCVIGAAAAFRVWSTIVCENGQPPNRGSISPFRITEITLDKSHKGLFSGLVVVAGTIISIILFFFYLELNVETSEMLYLVTDGIILVLVLILVLIGWIRFRGLSRDPIRGGPSIRAFLLVLSMIGFVAYNLCRTISSFDYIEHGKSSNVNRLLEFCVSVISIAAGVFQTLFIIDSMKRRCVSDREYTRKPGRGSVTFLLLSNLALCLFRIFQLKIVFKDFKYHADFYTDLWWRIIILSSVPLCVFYHFMASACLGYAWTRPYMRRPLADESFLARSDIATISKGDYANKVNLETNYRESLISESRDATLPWVRAAVPKTDRDSQPELRVRSLIENGREKPFVPTNGKRRNRRKDDPLEYEYDTSAHLFRNRLPPEIKEPATSEEEQAYAPVPPDHRGRPSPDHSPNDNGPPPFYGRIPPEQPYENDVPENSTEAPQMPLPDPPEPNGFSNQREVPVERHEPRHFNLARKRPPQFIFDDPKMKASDV